MNQNESLDTLIELHLDGQLTADQCGRLADLLKGSDEAAEKFWRAAHLHHAVVELADQQWGQISIADDSDASESIFPPPISFKEQADADHAEVGLKEIAQSLSYLLNQTLRKHRAALATAAILAIAGIALLFVMTGNEPTPPVAVEVERDNVNKNIDTPPITHPTVATLTATHNAQWGNTPAERALARGSKLHPNQRLTLTAGFAEITTNDGAVAILEAPATIELLDNNNALHLHIGKLVGLCHTESSKGFVVKTDHADITDLGTEFGVHAHAQGVDTTVFTGEVAVKTPNAPSRVIQHSQTARVSIDDEQPTLVVEDKLTKSFARRIPRASIITDASINLPGLKVEIASQAVREDAKFYTDRLHELNGFDQAGIPTVLLGGDMIRLPASARPGMAPGAESLTLEIEVGAPAYVYLLYCLQESEPTDWLLRDYERTDMRVGLDMIGPAGKAIPNTADQYESVLGPGNSIDRELIVFKRKQPVMGRTFISGSIEDSMYGVVVVPQRSNRSDPLSNSEDKTNE